MDEAKLKAYFAGNDVFLRDCGAALTKCEPGYAELELTLEPRHLTHVGRPHAHAGLLYTLAESASAAAMLAYGYNAFAVEGTIAYLDAVSEGKVTAVAKGADRHTEPGGSCRVRILAEDGRVVAKAKFTILYQEGSFTVE